MKNKEFFENNDIESYKKILLILKRINLGIPVVCLLNIIGIFHIKYVYILAILCIIITSIPNISSFPL